MLSDHSPGDRVLRVPILLFSLAVFYLCLTGVWGSSNPLIGRAHGMIDVLLPVLWGFAFYGIQREKGNAIIKQREILYRQFIENQPVGLFRTTIQDPGGRFLAANSALAKQFGYASVEQLMETTVSDLYRNPENRDHMLETLLASGHIGGVELEGKKKDGTGIFVSMTMWLIHDGDGKPMEIEGTIEDITSRKQAELALQRSEAMHRLAQRIAGLGHWEIAPIGDNLSVWSEEMYHIYECDPGTFDGSLDRFLQHVHPDDREDIVAQIADAREKGTPINHVHRIVMPDGCIKYIRSVGHVEYVDDGRAMRMVGTCQDVTQQKLAEMEKEESERRLLQAQKLEAIGTLAGGIAHDFNNILTSIIGFTQRATHLLPDDSPAIKKLDVVLQAGMRARDLVDHILAFSRESEQEFKPVQARIIVKEAIKLLRATIPANIAIKQDIASQCGRVLADPVQIHQVVMNLCTNAYHAIGANGGQIAVSLAPADLGPGDLQTGFDVSPGAHTHLRVSDTGRGMDRKTLGKIFDPYFTTKKRGEGTGLGLSVVHGIVKKHKGQISVHSEPGRGTAFDLFFPCVDNDGVTEPVVQAMPVAGGSEHILVVDDESLIVEMLSEMLTDLGYRITAFTSSDAALAFVTARSDVPDLMITDMTMPGLCGDDLSRNILKLLPELPIIICTGFSDNLDEEKAQAIGIRAFLAKPVAERRLTACVRNLLDQGASGEPMVMEQR